MFNNDGNQVQNRRCGGCINPWNHQATPGKTLFAVTIVALAAIATAVGVLSILSALGYNIHVFNVSLKVLGDITIYGGAAVTFVSFVIFAVGLSWLITRACCRQNRQGNNPNNGGNDNPGRRVRVDNNAPSPRRVPVPPFTDNVDQPPQGDNQPNPPPPDNIDGPQNPNQVVNLPLPDAENYDDLSESKNEEQSALFNLENAVVKEDSSEESSSKGKGEKTEEVSEKVIEPTPGNNNHTGISRSEEERLSQRTIQEIAKQPAELEAKKIEEQKRAQEIEIARQLEEQEKKNKAEAEKKVREEEAAAKQKAELAAKKVEEEKKAQALEVKRLQEEQKKLKSVEEEKKAKESPQAFLTWLQKDTGRLETEEHTLRLIDIIKKEEVKEEELRIFYTGIDEAIVLQILNFTQTSNSFNAIDEKIIEKALILETNFIQAINKKCPHRNPVLREKIETRLLGPSIFRHSMQDEEIVQIGTEFFNDLKKSGQLLTKEQFSALKGHYRDKGRDLGRILGANYIKKLAEELGLKHIKVPKKIAVIDEGINQLEADVSQSNLKLSCCQVTIHSEEITPLSRGTTREEVSEFLRILEATGFADFIGVNFFLGKNHNGEEGIYFIDTEYMNFRHHPFFENNVARAIGRVVQKEDCDWINEKEQPKPEGCPSYASRNQERVNRYLKLYDIKEVRLKHLMKTYVPETERRAKGVKFTYALK